jgi:hypothetical protein
LFICLFVHLFGGTEVWTWDLSLLDWCLMTWATPPASSWFLTFIRLYIRCPKFKSWGQAEYVRKSSNCSACRSVKSSCGKRGQKAIYQEGNWFLPPFPQEPGLHLPASLRFADNACVWVLEDVLSYFMWAAYTTFLQAVGLKEAYFYQFTSTSALRICSFWFLVL